jgi:hypothetical protein
MLGDGASRGFHRPGYESACAVDGHPDHPVGAIGLASPPYVGLDSG